LDLPIGRALPHARQHARQKAREPLDVLNAAPENALDLQLLARRQGVVESSVPARQRVDCRLRGGEVFTIFETLLSVVNLNGHIARFFGECVECERSVLHDVLLSQPVRKRKPYAFL